MTTIKPAKTGVIDPTRMYSTSALNRVGIGNVLLREARAAGVSPHNVNGSLWYSGGDIIEWIKSKPKKQTASEGGDS